MATGTNLSLQFFPASWQGEQRQTPTREYVDFEREGGKVRSTLLKLKEFFCCCCSYGLTGMDCVYDVGFLTSHISMLVGGDVSTSESW